MKDKITINSWDALADFKKLLDRWFLDYKYLVFTIPQFGRDRTLDQNAMSFELYTRIGKQLYGGDVKHARYECKLELGVPLLRENYPDFQDVYDKVIKPHDYPTKLKIMEYLPVSRIMSKRIFREYIDKIFDVYSEKGVDFGDLLEAK